MNPQSRKNLLKQISKMEKFIRKQQHYIETECSEKGDLLRLHAVWRIACKEVHGEEGVKAVLDQIEKMKEPNSEQAEGFRSEAEKVWPHGVIK